MSSTAKRVARSLIQLLPQVLHSIVLGRVSMWLGFHCRVSDLKIFHWLQVSQFQPHSGNIPADRVAGIAVDVASSQQCHNYVTSHKSEYESQLQVQEGPITETGKCVTANILSIPEPPGIFYIGKYNNHLNSLFIAFYTNTFCANSSFFLMSCCHILLWRVVVQSMGQLVHKPLHFTFLLLPSRFQCL